MLALLEQNERRRPRQDEVFLSLLQPASPWPHLRIVVCSEAGTTTLSCFLERCVPGTMFWIADRQYRVHAVESMSSAWAGVSTWDDFLLPPFGRFLQFRLGTPLILNAPPPSFSTHAPEMPSFPSPAPLFERLAQRWQNSGGPELPADGATLAAWLHDGGCVVSDYVLRGFPVLLVPKQHTLGFLGRITYTCRAEASASRQMLTALALFAFFASVGLFNAQGMGTTQVIIDT